ncbi:hypothetical protein MHYP_G00004610 [Metynnis hypsauchen]
MPKAKCINCQVQVPVQLLSLHLQDCQQIVKDSDSDCEVTNDTTEICPICEVPYPIKDLPLHASFCGDAALGEGVMKHVLSLAIARLKILAMQQRLCYLKENLSTWSLLHHQYYWRVTFSAWRLLKEEWTEEESSRITNLCLDWYCTVPTKDTNNLLIFQQLLSHAVLGRVTAQIKQIRKGIKDRHLATYRTQT